MQMQIFCIFIYDNTIKIFIYVNNNNNKIHLCLLLTSLLAMYLANVI